MTGVTPAHRRAANSRESDEAYAPPGPVAGGYLCTACGQHFGGLAAFDRHQLGTGGTTDPNPVRCLDPSDRGLRLTARPYGEVWSQPPPQR